jgi:hypothetical protein
MPAHCLDPQVHSSICAKLRSTLTAEQNVILDTPVCHNHLIAVSAVAGAGKTRTSAALVTEALTDPKVQQITVMCSMRSAADTALVRIGEAIDGCGLGDEGYAFPKIFVRTIHSLALASNKAAGRASQVVTSPDAFLEAAIDAALATARLEAIGHPSFGAFWAARAQPNFGVVRKMNANFVSKEFPNRSAEECGLLLYKKESVSGERALAVEGFEEFKASSLLASLRVIRTEVLSRGLDLSFVEPKKAALIREANEAMEQLGLVDHEASIRSFADAKEPVLRAGGLLLVDEAQDLSQAQLTIVQTTLKAGACVVAVGDSSQGICVFSGSSENPILQLVEWAKQTLGEDSVVEHRLTKNHRSTEPIVRASEAVLPDADIARRGHVEANGPGMPPLLLTGEEEYEARDVARCVQRMVQSGVQPGQIAILGLRNFGWGSPIASSLRTVQVPFTIRGCGRDTAKPAARILPLLQVGLGIEEFGEDLEAQSIIVQKFVRAINGASLPDELRLQLVTVASRHGMNPVDALLNHTDDLLNEVELAHPSELTDKRDLNGARILKRNVRKINVNKTALLVRIVVAKLNHWLSAACAGHAGIYPVVGLPSVKCGVPSGTPVVATAPPGLHVPTNPLASVARAAAVSFVKLDPARTEELNDLLVKLDVPLEENVVDTFVAVVGKELSKLVDSEERDCLVLSTIHKSVTTPINPRPRVSPLSFVTSLPHWMQVQRERASARRGRRSQ